MLGAVVKDDPHGVPILEIWEATDHCRVIPMQALATYSELLGIDDPAEVAEALVEEQDQDKAERYVNPFADAYLLLTHREKVREEEAARVRAKQQDKLAPADPRSVVLASALAAYRAVHVPITEGEECAMDRCRRRVRERLGLSFEPTAKPGAVSRIKATTVRAQEHPLVVEIGPETYAQYRQERRAKLSELLGQVTWLVDQNRRDFLHRLTGNTENPLGDVVVPQEAAPEPTAEDVLSKYGVSDAA